jgi:hypothetical protein
VGRKARFKNALAACKRLQTVLAEWFDGIRDAVQLEKTADDTRNKLKAFMDRHHFEERTRDDFRTISLDPDCQRLARFAHLLAKLALEDKQILFMAKANELFGGDIDEFGIVDAQCSQLYISCGPLIFLAFLVCRPGNTFT